MDIQPQSTKPISDDQELAKVLAGITKESNNNLSFEETPTPSTMTSPTSENVNNPAPMTPPTPMAPPVVGYNPPTDTIPTMPAPEMPMSNTGSSELEGIRKEALTELRPLVDKLDLEPEEKFDIYLLLLRSTDDKTLIAPAHEAARNIADESKRAQALLDIIKEIDYLSTNGQ